MTSTFHARSSALAAALLLSSGCGADGPTTLDELPPDLVATWYATSLVVGGTDLMDAGMRFRLTFRSDGTYEGIVTRDVTSFICEGEWDCVDEGTFGGSVSEVVFDPGPDQESLTPTLVGTDLTLTGTLDGSVPVTLSFVMPPIPELIGTWTSTSLQDADGIVEYDGVTTTLALTFEADGTYQFASTASDTAVFCDLKASCFGEGVYVANADLGEVTFDPDDEPGTLMVVGDSLQLNLFDGVNDWTFTRTDLATPGVQGWWYALSMKRDGAETADPYGWATQVIGFDPVLGADGDYQVLGLYGNPSDTFMCGPDQSCSTGGTYSAGLTSLTLSDGVSASVAMETTPLTLRLVGNIEGVSADILYVRIPPCTWVFC